MSTTATKPTNPFPADGVLVDTLARLLDDTAGHEVVQQAEAEGWAPGVWGPLAEMGAPWVGVAEEHGGSGGSVADAVAVLRAVGRYAAPVPVAETGILGGWLLGSAGGELPEGPLTVVPGRREDTLALAGGTLSGVAHNVPWASRADRIVALVDGQVVAVEPAAAGVSITARRNVAGEPREIVHFDGVNPAFAAAAPAGVDAVGLRRRGAFARAALMTGALERATEMTVDYANERYQFSKPVATFQAVAHHLVRCAEESQLAVMALNTAVAAASKRGIEHCPWEVAAFKAVAGEAADVVTTRAHQTHGAIGMTQEYSLHHLSRRLWAWRAEFGSTASWRRELGGLLGRHGGGQAWFAVVHGSEALTGA